jgi:hypothetical protein
MSKTGSYFLQHLVTVHGQYTYPQSRMAEDMCRKVAPFEMPEIETNLERLRRSALMTLASTLTSPNSKSLTHPESTF